MIYKSNTKPNAFQKQPTILNKSFCSNSTSPIKPTILNESFCSNSTSPTKQVLILHTAGTKSIYVHVHVC